MNIEPSHRNGSILIIDDDPYARENLESLLMQEKYHLEFVSSAAEGFESLKKKIPDVILLDVMMPEINGFDACRIIKQNEQWRHVPVILITALNDKKDMIRGLDSGADEFLSKPVSGPELRARVRSMLRIKKLYDELIASMKMREDMARMIVHDLKNPLFVILLNADLLKDALTDPDHVESINRITFQTQRLNSLLNDMLVTAKMEAGKPIISLSPVNLNRLLTVAYESYRETVRARQIEMILDLPNESATLSLDEKLFVRVIDNLINNALKFSSSGSKIILKASYDGASDHARIQVADQGMGIAEQDRERVFEKYEIVKLKKTTLPQIGLGLPFCKMVVEALGGRIHVGPNQPTGSVFTIELGTKK